MKYSKLCAYENCGQPFDTNRKNQKYHTNACRLLAFKDRVAKEKEKRYAKACAEFEVFRPIVKSSLGTELIEWMHLQLALYYKGYNHVIHYTTLWCNLRETIYPVSLRNSWRRPCREAHERKYPEDAKLINHRQLRNP